MEEGASASRRDLLFAENSFEKEDEDLDPRVMEELEKLNTCTDEINRLETQLDDANAIFRWEGPSLFLNEDF